MFGFILLRVIGTEGQGKRAAYRDRHMHLVPAAEADAGIGAFGIVAVGIVEVC
jgi:hypothetical protein